MSHPTSIDCFLLNYTGRDERGRFVLRLYAVTPDHRPVRITVDNYRPLFFVARTTSASLTAAAAERAPLPLRTMSGEDADCLYFRTIDARRRAARLLREKLCRVFETDVSPAQRYLMERMIRGGMRVEGTCTEHGGRLDFVNPKVRGADIDVSLRVLSLDIETNARSGEIYSIACTGDREAVFVRGEGEATETIQFCDSERSMLQSFFDHLASEDPDILIGWNVVDFDLSVIADRCRRLRIPLRLGRDKGAEILPADPASGRTSTPRLPGRVVLDVPTMLRALGYTFEQYSLDHVASVMLGRHKEITARGQEKIREIDRLYAQDKAGLAHYNLEDTRLTMEIFTKAGILPNTVERTRRSGLLLGRAGASVAAFDFLYLPRLHREGYVAGDVADVPAPVSPLAGGFVMEPRPGLYENVLVLDFKSLYPTIIMTFKIDPLGRVAPSDNRIRGPAGPSFAREPSILPAIIAELMQARGEAKRAKNPYLSRAIKLLMNSFYGVMGTTGCRFFAPELAETITASGRYLFRETVAHIESSTGHRVIYGDTDSLFILLGPGVEAEATETGQRIAGETTAWLREHLREGFGVESALELEFETHFRHFFVPALRGTTQGSKKRYCGVVERDGRLELAFKGLESARSDWTEAAKEFQRELYLRMFTGRPVKDYVRATVEELHSGTCDKKLVYRKHLRKQLHQYTGSPPPHVRAARMLDSPPRVVAYCMTAEGPQPVEKLTAPLDYDHYVETQIRPVAEPVLAWLDLDFTRIVSDQQDLFGTG